MNEYANIEFVHGFKSRLTQKIKKILSKKKMIVSIQANQNK